MICGACQCELGQTYLCVEFGVPRVVITFCTPLCAFWGGARWHSSAPTSAKAMRELYGAEAVHEVPEAANSDDRQRFCYQEGGYIEGGKHVRASCVFEPGHEGPHSWEPGV